MNPSRSNPAANMAPSTGDAMSRPCGPRLLHGAIAAALLALSVGALPAQAAGPAYTWGNVNIGGGYVPGIIAHPGQQGLYYARTDMGGAYRYNNTTKTWIPLNDGLTGDQFSYGGIDAIAIDPTDTNKLYIVAGMYYTDTIRAVLLRSTNQGASRRNGV